MNFLIFRIFLDFFWINLNLFLIFLKIKKYFYMSRADVAKRRHVVTRADTCVHVCARVCVCVRVSN